VGATALLVAVVPFSWAPLLWCLTQFPTFVGLQDNTHHNDSTDF